MDILDMIKSDAEVIEIMYDLLEFCEMPSPFHSRLGYFFFHPTCSTDELTTNLIIFYRLALHNIAILGKPDFEMDLVAPESGSDVHGILIFRNGIHTVSKLHITVNSFANYLSSSVSNPLMES